MMKPGINRGIRENGETPAPIRPKKRSDCVNAGRPCVYVSCKYNLYLDVDPKRGSIQYNFPGLEPYEMKHSCALDIANEGGETLAAISDCLNITRERVRQIEKKALKKAFKKRSSTNAKEILEFFKEMNQPE